MIRARKEGAVIAARPGKASARDTLAARAVLTTASLCCIVLRNIAAKGRDHEN